MTARPDIVEEAEALDREATPGPWEVQPAETLISSLWKQGLPAASVVVDTMGTGWGFGENVAATPAGREADARFIARARELVPALAAELKALRAALLPEEPTEEMVEACTDMFAFARRAAAHGGAHDPAREGIIAVLRHLAQRQRKEAS